MLGKEPLASQPSVKGSKTIKVSWTRITNEMCDSICVTLVDRESLVPVKKVELLDNQLGPSQTLKIATCLESSPVSDIFICYNDVGKEGCDGLAGVLNVSAKLQQLDLRGNNLTPAHIRKLVKSVGASTSIKRLGLAHNKLGPDGVALLTKSLERNTFLTVLDLSMNEIGAAGAACIASLLSDVANGLKTLQLYGNHLGAAGVRLIVQALMHNKELHVLNIGNNNATDEVCAEIGEMLSHNGTLEELDIRLNSFSAAGIKEMMKWGRHENSNLRKLTLSGNPFGAVGAEEVSKALTGKGRTTFESLDVSSCGLGPIGGIRIAHLITCSSSLREIYLSDNSLDNDAAISIARSISESITLSMIDLSLNNIGEDGATALVDAAQLNIHLSSLVLHGNIINRVVQKKIDNLLEERINRNRVQKSAAEISIKNALKQ